MSFNAVTGEAAFMQKATRKADWAGPGLLLAVGILAAFESGYQHPVRYYAFGLVGVMALAAVVRRQVTNLPRAVWVPLLLFVFFGALSYTWSVRPGETVNTWQQVAFYAMLFVLAASLGTDGARSLVAGLLVIGTALAVIALAQYLFLTGSRVQATFVNPNPFGAFMAMLSMLGLSQAAKKDGWLRVGAAVILLDALVLSGSRGAMLALILSMPVVVAGVGRHDWRRTGVNLLVTGLLVASTTWGLVRVAPLIKESLLGLSAWQAFLATLVRPDSFLASSTAGRLSFWEVAARMFAANPLGGVGLGNFHTDYFLFWNGGRFYSHFTHNYYLQTMAELGIGGFIALVSFLGAFIHRAVTRRPTGLRASTWWGLAGALLVFLIHSGMDFTWDIPVTAALFWTLAGVWWSLGDGSGVAKEHSGRGVRAGLTAVITLIAFLGMAQGMGVWRAAGARSISDSQGLAASVTAWASAARWAPWDAAYRWQYARALRAGGREDEGLKVARQAVDLRPNETAYRAALAQVLSEKGRVEEGRNLLQGGIPYNGFYPFARRELGYYELAQGNFDRARDVMGPALKVIDYPMALAPTEKARHALEQQKVELFLGLARASEGLGDMEERHKNLEAVLAIDPGNSVARRELSRQFRDEVQALGK